MTRNSTSLAAGALVLVLAAAPAGATETLREQSGRVVSGAGLTGLEVENPRGTIEVRPSADGRLHITALKIVRAAGRGEARELADATRVEARADGERYRMRVSYPQRQVVHVGFWELFREGVVLPQTEVRLTLEAPAGLAVRLTSTSGDLATADLAGRQTLETTSGDIQVEEAIGPVSIASTSGDVQASFGGRARVRTVSGDITVDRAAHALDAHSTSGDLVVRDAADSLVLGSVSGDIHVQRAPHGVTAGTTSGGIVVHAVEGSCQLDTSSGDVDAAFGPRLARAEITSGSGDLVARLAPGLGAALDLRTSNGSIDVSVPLEVKTVTRRMVSGRVGGGQVPVVIRSSSGDIQILSGGR